MGVDFLGGNMLYIDLGQKIREERIGKGYTQEELGEKIDSTGAYIGQIERGERSASMSKIVLIAQALNLSLDYLIGNFTFEQSNCIDGKLAEELKGATNRQKELMIDIIKVIKKYK